jgi:hypothetical protein
MPSRSQAHAQRTPTWPYDWEPRRYDDDDDDDDDDDGHSDDDDDDAAEFDRARRALPGPVRLVRVVRLRVLPPAAHLGRPFSFAPLSPRIESRRAQK